MTSEELHITHNDVVRQYNHTVEQIQLHKAEIEWAEIQRRKLLRLMSALNTVHMEMYDSPIMSDLLESEGK